MKKVFITGASGFIGTNLIELLEGLDYEIQNYDLAAPLNPQQSKYWVKGDIMNVAQMRQAISAFSPEILIHLAARTDTLSSDPKDYDSVTVGSQNVIDVVKASPSIKRLVMTSTQYVYKSRVLPFPSSDTDFAPHTVYGDCKAISEKVTREGNLECTWTIVRPANIWGPWHMRYPVELWRAIARGIYIHPGKEPVIRTYGYVKNVVHQIRKIIEASPDVVHQKVYYLGDMPIDSYQWLNEFSKQLTGKNARRVPSFILKSLALFGDTVGLFGIKFPLHSLRYRNMVEDYVSPTNETIAAFGLSHPSMSENVLETIDWVKREFTKQPNFWKKYFERKAN